MARIYFQSKPYREYVKAQTCTWRLLGYLDCDGPSDPQHDPPLSSQTSDDLDCIPMCRKHHNYHKDKPLLYRSVITEAVLTATKHSMLTGFFRSLELDTEKAKVKVRSRKQAEKVQDTTGKWSKPQPNSRPRGKKRKYSRIEK